MVIKTNLFSSNSSIYFPIPGNISMDTSCWTDKRSNTKPLRRIPAAGQANVLIQNRSERIPAAGQTNVNTKPLRTDTSCWTDKRSNTKPLRWTTLAIFKNKSYIRLFLVWIYRKKVNTSTGKVRFSMLEDIHWHPLIKI